nr:uncharacterized protein LOC128694709 [Cherax quadricarinatus]XP_053640936.1 uncharacterized protein LOC128694709 [Cherax quadricarinatus]
MVTPSLQTLRSNINCDRYFNCVNVVAQREMCRVFMWLYHHTHQHEPGLYVGDCLRRTPNGLRNIKTKQMAKLNRREKPVNMDITLLYILLQRTCNLTEDRPAGSIWNKPTTPAEEQSLEHTLYKIKEMRNEFDHEILSFTHMTEQDLKDRVSKLCDMCCHIVQEAGQSTGRSPQSVKEATDNIKKSINDLQTSWPSSGITPQKFSICAKQEQKEQRGTALDKSISFFMPVIKRVTGMTAMTHEEVLYLEHFLKWRCVDGTLPQIIFLRGDTGAGKTFLSQQVLDVWLKNNKMIEDLDECDLVLLIQCRDVFTRDLIHLLRHKLPGTILSCGPVEVENILNSLRILWIIDGYEEASFDAKALLMSIFNMAGPEQIVLITSRPEYSLEITSMLPPGKPVCEVTLCGLSSEGRSTLLRSLLIRDNSDVTERNEEYYKFMKYLQQLTPEVQKELSNPLKLILSVQIWKEKSMNDVGATLSHLYAAIQDVQLKNVIEKLEVKCSLTEEEICERVQNWLQILYKVAFNMTIKNRFMIIDESDEKLLKDKGMFLPSYTDCFSTFLTPTTDYSPMGLTQYMFVHNTQQNYFAAQHICYLMSEETFDEEKLAKLLNVDLSQIGQVDRFYEVLLHTISILIIQKNLNKDTAKVLTKVINHCQNCNLPDVVIYSEYSDVVVREVSSFMPDSWAVTDTNVKAIYQLLQYATPSVILLILEENPDTIVSLKPLLNRIAERSVKIFINFLYYFLQFENSCDDYIKILCESSAKCVIYSLKGKLSADGCFLLYKMPDIRKLDVIVQNQTTLEMILVFSQSAENLEELALHITVRDFNPRICVSAGGWVSLDVFLPFIDDAHVMPVTNLLRRMSSNYRTLALSGVSAEGARRFVQGLKAKGVRVENLSRLVKIDGEIKGVFLLSYGRVPLRCTEMQFIDMWHDPEVNLVVSNSGLQVNVAITPNAQN